MIIDGRGMTFKQVRGLFERFEREKNYGSASKLLARALAELEQFLDGPASAEARSLLRTYHERVLSDSKNLISDPNRGDFLTYFMHWALLGRFADYLDYFDNSVQADNERVSSALLEQLLRTLSKQELEQLRRDLRVNI